MIYELKYETGKKLEITDVKRVDCTGDFIVFMDMYGNTIHGESKKYVRSFTRKKETDLDKSNIHIQVDTVHEGENILPTGQVTKMIYKEMDKAIRDM